MPYMNQFRITNQSTRGNENSLNILDISLFSLQINFVADAPVPVVSSKVSPLHLAVESGLPDTVSFLLESNADVNRLDHNGRSTLHLAVERTDCECTRMILCRGADVHRLDKDGKTALQVASKFGHVELVRILLEHSAQVFHEGQRGPSPLHIAAIEGHVPLIDIFSRYVDVNIRVPCCENGKEKTALHLAAERGLVETVRFLLERFGADVNVLDSDDQNALHCAMMHKHDHRRMRRKEDYDAMVDLFLKKHVNIKQQNADGNTPLHLAAQNQFHRVVEMLLLAQADPLGKNNIEQIPLDMIPEFDVPMRQLFNKYAVITSPYITNSALQQPVAPEPIQTQKKVEFAPPHVLEPIAEVETIKPTSTKSKKSAPIPPKHSALKQGEPRMSSQQTAHFAPKSTKGASIYTAKVSTQHGTKVQVSQAPVPISLRKVDSAESEPKVFHVHVKSIPSLAATENGHLEGPHCSVIHTNDFKKTPSAPTLVR